jgi:hypothetical protein
LTKNIKFALQLDITRDIYFLSLFIQSTVSQTITARDFAQYECHLPYFISFTKSIFRQLHSFPHSLVLMSMLCSELCSIRLCSIFHLRHHIRTCGFSSLLIFPIILLVNNYSYCSSRIYDFIY